MQVIKIKYHNQLRMVLYLSMLLGVFACKRSELDFPEANLNLVKVYSDTTASGENSSIKITAGRDRLYMTYGLGSAFFNYTNGLITPGVSELSGKLMATDLQGNLIWVKPLMSGIAITSPVELDNGEIVVCGANLWSYNNRVNTRAVYTFKYSANGEALLKDSLEFPSNFGDGCVPTFMDIIKIDNNNILIYGSINDYLTNSFDGFTLVYNLKTGNQTLRKFGYRTPDPGTPGTTVINNCIKTQDGGYMFLGTVSGSTSLGNPDFIKAILIKTNANFDTIWTRRYDYFKAAIYMNTPYAGNVIEMPNGGFRFCMNENTNFNYNQFRGFVYEVSPTGDSLKARVIEGFNNQYCAAIHNDKHGNTLALVTEYPAVLLPSFNGFFTQINTKIHVYDAELNLKYINPFQTERSDFYTAICNTPQSKLALFGLVATKSSTHYTPGLMLLNF
jgi:hypothetical protein